MRTAARSTPVAKGATGRSSRLLPLVAAAGIALPARAAAPARIEAEATAEAFEAELEAVRALAADERWAEARRALLDLLERHGAAPWVRRALPEVERELERATFWSRHRAPRPRDVVAGELLRHDPQTGELALRYELDADGPPGDFVREGAWWVHPMAFAGPFEVDLEGRAPEGEDAAETPQLLLVRDGAPAGEDAALRVDLGAAGGHDRPALGPPPRLVRVRGERSEVLDARELPALAPGRYRARVDVGSGRVGVRVDGREVLAADVDGTYGRVALRPSPGLRSIVLRGRADPTWLRGRVDAEVQAAWRDFAAGYDARADLPAALRAAPAPPPRPAEPAPPVEDESSFPGRPLTTADRHQLAAIAAFQRGDFERGVRELEALDADAMPAEHRLFLTALFLVALEDWPAALAPCEGLVELAPSSADARVLLGRAYGELGRTAEALREFRGVIATTPRTPGPYRELVQLLLSDGRASEARAVIERAFAAGIDAPDLEEVRGLIARATGGPRWAHASEHASPHYLVASDAGEAVCREAAAVLEEAHALYGLLLGRFADRGHDALRVFVFAGEAGYRAYAADLAAPEQLDTAGLYIPALRQLLVWMPPEREAWRRALRHEGLHQYLDVFLDDVPQWFNEGLAEYFETARLREGTVHTGAHLPGRVELLLSGSTRWTPLERLVRLDRLEFYGRPELHYAQAWALVHHLLEGGPAARRAFDTYLGALGVGLSADDALARAFGDADWAALERDVRAHVRSLR